MRFDVAARRACGLPHWNDDPGLHRRQQHHQRGCAGKGRQFAEFATMYAC
jgi:hypothetical protein